MKSSKNKIGTVLPELNGLSEDRLINVFQGASETRIYQLFMCMVCMLDQRTSCLNRAAQAYNRLCGRTHKTQKTASIYQAFLRIFSNGNTERLVQGLFCLIVRILVSLGSDLELVLDRTQWEYKGTVKNVLVLGCIYHYVFIPLVFNDLGRKGNSNFKYRKALIAHFLSYWKQTQLPLPKLYLAGDREFIGVAWWDYLKNKNIQFAFRLKEGQPFYIWLNGSISDTRYKANLLQKALGVNTLSHAEIILLGDYILDLFICKNSTPNAKEKYVYIVTNFESIANAPDFYRRRWTIEVCFKHLKSNGFNLEKSGLTDDFKIELLFAMLSFIYTLCIVRGIIAYEEVKMANFTTNNLQKQYKKVSLFSFGFSQLMNHIYYVQDFIDTIINQVQIRNYNST